MRVKRGVNCERDVLMEKDILWISVLDKLHP